MSEQKVYENVEIIWPEDSDKKNWPNRNYRSTKFVEQTISFEREDGEKNPVGEIQLS